jgi:hypothetical protein
MLHHRIQTSSIMSYEFAKAPTKNAPGRSIADNPSPRGFAMPAVSPFIQRKPGNATGILQRMKFNEEGHHDAEHGRYDTENLEEFSTWVTQLGNENLLILKNLYGHLQSGKTRSERIALSIVRRAFNKTEKQEPVQELPQLENLPRSEWWRLFIDMQFWEQENDKTALRFDNEKSPGFYNTMMVAFERLKEIKPGSGHVPLNYKIYEEHHMRVIEGVMRQKGHTQEFEPVPHEVSSGASAFPLSDKGISKKDTELPKIASAVQELIEEGMLQAVGNVPDMLKVKNVDNPDGPASWMHHDSAYDQFRITNKLSGQKLEQRVNDLFARYAQEIKAANDKETKLSAIARLVRALHVGHFFSDANGRLNVMFLMNKLLREEGFSPAIITDPALFGGSRDVASLAKEIDEGIKIFGATI